VRGSSRVPCKVSPPGVGIRVNATGQLAQPVVNGNEISGSTTFNYEVRIGHSAGQAFGFALLEQGRVRLVRGVRGDYPSYSLRWVCRPLDAQLRKLPEPPRVSRRQFYLRAASVATASFLIW